MAEIRKKFLISSLGVGIIPFSWQALFNTFDQRILPDRKLMRAAAS
jgi:hypothetical protein